MYNPFSLEGKTILVTGASSGIGRQTAIECSKLGATLVITARNEERLKETLSALEGVGHLFILADLSDNSQLESLVSELPKLDGFSCNAGIANTNLISFLKEEEIENVFKTNTFSSILLTKYLIKKKKLNKGASIVYTSSVGNVHCASIANGLYGASKCAIDGFMRTAALELASKGIRCNSVNPGVVESNLTENGGISTEQREADLKRYPLGRYGKPMDIAHAIIYLLSDASSWVTGTALKIDGGYTIQ